ncbi:MAG: hypothetical protein RIC55_13185 [Pirellulaceae bacterium]
MRDLCEDITHRLPALGHIDMDRVAVSFSQARKRVRHGLYATLTPMRFEAGSLTTRRRGQSYTVQRLYAVDGREMLYILSFYLPRFLDETFREKLITVFHELWHVSPNFDGDIRRHPGRCHVHTQSQSEYDAQMAVLAEQWLALGPPGSLYSFLHDDFDTLYRRHGGVYGVKVPHPKLVRQ